MHGQGALYAAEFLSVNLDAFEFCKPIVLQSCFDFVQHDLISLQLLATLGQLHMQFLEQEMGSHKIIPPCCALYRTRIDDPRVLMLLALR